MEVEAIMVAVDITEVVIQGAIMVEVIHIMEDTQEAITEDIMAVIMEDTMEATGMVEDMVYHFLADC